MNEKQPLLSLEHVRVGYPRLDGRGWMPIIEDLSLSLARGDIACLLGPSGCGKSTILRAISGFEALQEGQIKLNGKVVSSSRIQVAPNVRRVGMVFQDFALFPHLSVLDNVTFGLRSLPVHKRREVGLA